NVQYYWKITAKNSAGSTAGPVWSFTTGAPPTALVLLTPANGATNTALATPLTWSASGATGYDVKFGTTNPPPQVAANQISASYLRALGGGTTYFWQIVARNAFGTLTSAVGSFTTIAAAPSVPTSLSPANGAGSIALNAVLSWTSAGATS